MEEHLREIRTLRLRLEDSIQTNDRLRQQLEERLASSARNGGERLAHSHSSSQKVQQCVLAIKCNIFACMHMFIYFIQVSNVSTFLPGGAPTNIYIQGLDSVNQLSNEIRVLKEENHTLQDQLQQARTGKILVLLYL